MNIEQAMNKYLVSNQARSIISRLNARYHILKSGEVIGNFLHRAFNFKAPSFMVAGINKHMLQNLGVPCYQTPCLFRIMDNRRVTNQLIFGRIMSKSNDNMINDLLNFRHLPKLQLNRLVDKVNQINHSTEASRIRLKINGNQLIFTSRLFPMTFVASVEHLLEIQSAVQRGQTILDDGTRYFF